MGDRYEGNMLTLINQETLCIAYLNIHVIAILRNTNFNNKQQFTLIVTLIGNLVLIFMKKYNKLLISRK